MRRFARRILLPAALVGALGTILLLVKLLEGDEGRLRRNPQSPAGLSEPRIAGGTRVHVPPGPPPGGSGTRAPGAGPGSGGGGREPFDSPETRALRLQQTSELARLLLEIPGTESATQRRDKFVKLGELIRLLGRRVDPVTRDELLALLTTMEPQWRALVGETLGQLRGDEETAAKLVEMLNGRPEHVATRRAILLALQKMDVPGVVPALLATLDEDFEDKDSIVAAIGQVGGRDAYDGLLAQLGKALDPKVRGAIETALGQAKDPITMAKIARALPEADAEARASYIEILGATRDPTHADAVRNALLRETAAPARKAAIRALGLFGDPESGVVLLEIMRSASQQDRADAARALGYVRNLATVERLAESWGELDTAGRVAVMGAAARLSGQPGEKLLGLAREAIHERESRVRASAARVLGQRGYDDGVEPLLEFLRRADTPGERQTAFHALLEIRTRKAAEAGLDALGREQNARKRQWYEEQFRRIIDGIPGRG